MTGIPSNWTKQNVTPKSRIYWSEEGDILVQSDHIILHLRDGTLENSFFGLTGQHSYDRARDMINRIHRSRQDDE